VLLDPGNALSEIDFQGPWQRGHLPIRVSLLGRMVRALDECQDQQEKEATGAFHQLVSG